MTAASTSTADPGASIGQVGVSERLSVAFRSMGAPSVVSVLLLLVGTGVALLAHVYRKKLPKKLHASWYKHHGLAKAGGMLSLCLIIVLL